LISNISGSAKSISGIVLAFYAYVAYLVFAGKIVMRLLALRETSGGFHPDNVHATSPLTILKTIGDILFFPRLFRVNPRLWFGEFFFHISFSLVILRHLRYMLNPVPACVTFLQPPGECAGYLLPLSLLYIVIIKKGIERKDYVSRYNFFLLSLVFLISVTGLLMKTFVRPDIPGVKDFMLSLFTFVPCPLHGNSLFIFHYLMAFILLAFLPTHIFAAPFAVMEARKRQDSLGLLMHD
jgi:nitrate reductase gamma subunit